MEVKQIMTNLIENQKCLEYMSFLHGDSIDDKRFKKTYVFLGVKSPNKNFRPFSVRVEEILNGEYLKNFKFNPSCDYYVTSNTFRKYKGKSREMLFSLENIIIDIDNHSGVVNDTQIQHVIEVVTSKADFKPTAVNKTGRGVQFVYQIEKVSYKLESFFRNIADCLIENIESIISQDTTLYNV
jgi:hypothetical protein